ncbi:MAG TPA: hypothetical protein VF403_00575, partial [Kofleriaceae bacterium]
MADESLERAREQRSALRWASLIAALVVAWLVMPIGVGILFGTFLAFMVERSHERLKHLVGERWSAIGTVAGAGVALAATIGGLGWLFVAKGTALAR